MKHLLIVNPAAGGRDATPFVRAELEKLQLPERDTAGIYVTKAPMDACAKIRAEAASGEPLRVYACGGDGTLNECVNGAAGLDNAAVACFPTGTGNDFIRTFGRERERFRSLRELVCGETRKLDLIKCCGRCGISICSVGIDARVGVDVHRYTGIPLIGHKFGYAISAVVNVIRGVTDAMRVEFDGKVFEDDVNLVCACNGSFYGGGFNPVPEARPDDGRLEFLVIHGVSRAKIPALILHYARGEYARFPQYITHLSGSSIHIDCPYELDVNIDGEALRAKSLSFELVPAGVNFVFPSNMAYFASGTEENM